MFDLRKNPRPDTRNSILVIPFIILVFVLGIVVVEILTGDINYNGIQATWNMITQ